MSSPAPQTPQKPQAVSHMLWFFVFPSLFFMGWASYRFVSGVMSPKPRDAFSKLAEVRAAKSAGDRWQAAYGLTQALQKMSHDGELAAMPTDKKQTLYGTLAEVLHDHSSDARLKKYMLLTMGQMGDPLALPALEEGATDKTPEVRFYAAWGLIEILLKHPEVITPKHLNEARNWLKDPDPSFKKIAASFLTQQKDKSYLSEVAQQLKDPSTEVRWNAAVALASVGDTSAKSTLKEIFDIKALRAAEITSSDDLTRIISAAYGAAKKLGDQETLAAAASLRTQVSDATPEGRAIHAAIR